MNTPTYGPIEAPRAVPDAPARPCVVRGCAESRAKDSDRCAEHRWEQWHQPEWVRRATTHELPAVDCTRSAA